MGDDIDDEFGDDFDDEVSGEFADDDFDSIDDESPKRSLSSAVTIGGEIAQYRVKKGDTLMWIAYQIYGDYSMWKNIRNLNPGIGSGALAAGEMIKYEAPEERFDYTPAGKPYLIQKGDTLGTISKDKYGTSAKWKDI